MLNPAPSSPDPVESCFHCGLPVDDTAAKYETRIGGSPKSMCCPGCQAVAQAIVDSGLEDYYRYRDPVTASRPEEIVPDELSGLAVYDRENIRGRYVKPVADDRDESTLMLEGLTCAACAWLIENRLKKMPGIREIEVNYATQTANVTWDPDSIKLSEILTTIRRLGYGIVPYEPRARYRQLQSSRRNQLKRIGITAALGMQVMILSVALYFAESSVMEPQWRQFFYNTGLLLTVPVMLYSASGFFSASARQLARIQPGMDVPVSLGLLLAFCASTWATITGEGEVYFDSVVMFVFFLLVARYFMNTAQLRAGRSIERLATAMPLTALRLESHHGNARARSVTAQELDPGDWVRVLPGHTFPADGTIVEGDTALNLAIISGESRPVRTVAGDAVIAGSINIENPVVVEVSACGGDTVLSGIEELAGQCLATKPSSTLIDFIARWFVTGVLLLAAATAVYWWNTSPSRWLEITVSVLVVSCPCALSLAVPTAVSASISRLLDMGLLVTTGESLERLAGITRVLFDKTGTLTEPGLRLESIEVTGQLGEEVCLAVAAALEQSSEHPIARAITVCNDAGPSRVSNWGETAGLGVCGTVEGVEYFLGSARYIREQTGLETTAGPAGIQAILAGRGGILARLGFAESIREGASEAIAGFSCLGLPVTMVSGDRHEPANRLAGELGIGSVYSDCNPRDKLERVRKLQQKGERVLMVGDGVNDSPVLAAADASIAVAGASPLAVSGADIIMVNPSLAAITGLYKQAVRTARIIRQNITWAIGYNLVALPFAAMGHIKPLFAAIGMSVSSLIVVLNAIRLRK